MHVAEQDLTFGIHKIDFTHVEGYRAAMGGGGSGLPALAQFRNPRSRQSAFQTKPQLAGVIVQRDLEHVFQADDARRMPA
jgi:hypothetical protein